jgi:hypothetical protein
MKNSKKGIVASFRPDEVDTCEAKLCFLTAHMYHCVSICNLYVHVYSAFHACMSAPQAWNGEGVVRNLVLRIPYYREISKHRRACSNICRA